MILIKTEVKQWLRTFLAPVLIALAVLTTAVATPSVVMAAQEKGGKKCTDGIDNDNDGLIDGADPDCGGGDGGGDGGTDVPDTYNLARAKFTNFGGQGNGNGGISADGLDTCTVPRPGGPSPVTYDYWAWQEELLSPAESIYGQHVGAQTDCVPPHNNRSDVSGGGRWFLITTAGRGPWTEPQRWLVFDFSESTDGTGCPNLDGDDSGETALDLGPIYTKDLNPDDTNPCVDHLTVRLAADRILKGGNPTEQTLKLSIRWQPPGSEYWPPWGEIEYDQPLYLRAPANDGPFAGRDCTVMSTRPSPKDEHNRATATLYSWETPSTSDFVGTYNLPLEVCVIRTSD